MKKEIPNYHFEPKKKTHFEFEILPWKRLFEVDASNIGSPERQHRMRFFQIILFKKGSGEHNIDFKKYKYKSGNVLFVAEHQVQQFTRNLKTDAVLLVFTKEFLYKTAHDRKILQGYRIFDYSLSSPLLTLSKENMGFYSGIISEIEKEFSKESLDPLREELIRNLLRVLLSHAEMLKRSDETPSVLSFQNDFNLFKEQLEKDFTKTRNAKDYEFSLRFSSKKLNQIIKINTGKNAKEFIDERVILEIKRLLAYTDLTLGEIAMQTGFDEPTNLVKFFKRYTMKTPIEFRKEVKQI